MDVKISIQTGGPVADALNALKAQVDQHEKEQPECKPLLDAALILISKEVASVKKHDDLHVGIAVHITAQRQQKVKPLGEPPGPPEDGE